jgi:hypothetical protein
VGAFQRAHRFLPGGHAEKRFAHPTPTLHPTCAASPSVFDKKSTKKPDHSQIIDNFLYFLYTCALI